MENSTYRFLKCAVLKHPPYTGIDPKIFPEVEEGLQGHSSCVQRAFDVAWYAFGGVLISLYRHNAMPKVASKEQILPQTAGICFGHVSYSSFVRGCKICREAFV
jgi:hypothetical protein